MIYRILLDHVLQRHLHSEEFCPVKKGLVPWELGTDKRVLTQLMKMTLEKPGNG
jgi:hypothetical protein